MATEKCPTVSGFLCPHVFRAPDRVTRPAPLGATLFNIVRKTDMKKKAHNPGPPLMYKRLTGTVPNSLKGLIGTASHVHLFDHIAWGDCYSTVYAVGWALSTNEGKQNGIGLFGSYWAWNFPDTQSLYNASNRTITFLMIQVKAIEPFTFSTRYVSNDGEPGWGYYLVDLYWGSPTHSYIPLPDDRENVASHTLEAGQVETIPVPTSQTFPQGYVDDWVASPGCNTPRTQQFGVINYIHTG